MIGDERDRKNMKKMSKKRAKIEQKKSERRAKKKELLISDDLLFSLRGIC